MKKSPIRTTLTTLLLLLFFSQIAVSQSIVSANPDSTTAGESISMIVTGTGTDFTNSTGAYIYRPGVGGMFYNATSFIPYSSTVMEINCTLPPNAPLGEYTVGVYGPSDLGNGLKVGIGPGSAYGLLSGYVNEDFNNNCTIDPGENPIPYSLLMVDNQYLATDANGFYSIWLPLGTHTVYSYNPPPFNFYSCSNNISVNLTVPLDTVSNVNIYLDTIVFPFLDRYMVIHQLRPGFPVCAGITFKNTGNSPTQPVNAYFRTDVSKFSSYTFAGFSNTSVNGDTVFGTIPSLLPGQIAGLGINGTLSPSVGIGSTVGCNARIFTNSSTGYYDLFISREVTGSFDPNDKQVWTQDGNPADGFIEPSDSLLTYLIRFQNTGNDTAFNIFVRDTIDEDLDLTSLNILNSSHPWTLTVNGTGNVQWNFPNVLLVDSVTNEPDSHGFIAYSIKRKPGLPLGTPIDNTAHIYFDFNAPVVTNTVTSVICPDMQSTFAFSGGTANDVNFAGSAVSTVTNWVWDFGDGNSSTLQSPSHTYASSGTYTVCMIASNSCGRIDTTCQQVGVNCVGPTAAFNSSANNNELSFTDMTTASPTSWLWDFGDGNTSTVANPQHTFTLAGTYNVCLVTGALCGYDTICQTVTATCPPHAAGFSASVNQLAATFTNSGTGGTDYLWDFGDGNTSTAASPTHNYTLAGNYSVCLLSSNTCDSDSICQTVTTTCPPHTAGFSSSVNQLAASFTNSGSGGTTYLWDFGDGNSSTAASPSHTYTLAGTYTVCLLSSNNCDSDSICQTVTTTCPPHTASFSSSVNQLSATFTNSGTGGTTYLWDFGDGNTSTAVSPSHTYSTQGTYTVCLSSTNTCDSDSICQSIAVICPSPTAGFSSSVNQLLAFFNNTGTGGTTYLWTFGDGNSSTTASPSHTYSLPGTYNVCLVSTNACGTDTSCQTVTVSCPAPVSSFSNTVSGNLASFTDLSGGAPSSWQWAFGDGTFSSSQNPSHTYASVGTFLVCLTATSICGSDTFCSNVTTTCAVPVAGFGSQHSNLTVNFSDQSSNAPAFWQWAFGDGITSTQANPIHTYSSAGIYNVCLTVTNACGSDTLCDSMNVVVVGMVDELLNRFDLYPNPAQDRFVVDMELNEEALVDFRLYNAVGSLVQTEPQALLAGEVRKQFDVSSLPSGMYLLEMRINGQSRTWKVIKQ